MAKRRLTSSDATTAGSSPSGAVRRALAGALEVRVGDVSLRLGATSRHTVFTVAARGVTAKTMAGRLSVLRDGP
jgi:hypothetical protein